MSVIEGELVPSGRDPRTGRLLPGHQLRKTTQKQRHSLSRALVRALDADFREHGPAVVERVRQEDPVAYLAVCSRLGIRQMDYEREDAQRKAAAEGTTIEIRDMRRSNAAGEEELWD